MNQFGTGWVLSFCVCLTSCAMNPRDPQAVYQATELSRDRFTKEELLRGPTVSSRTHEFFVRIINPTNPAEPPPFVPEARALPAGADAELAKMLEESDRRIHEGVYGLRKPKIQLYVVTKSADWLFVTDAYSSSGTPLDLVLIDRDVAGRGTQEHVAINLTPSDLDRMAQEGLEVKLVGKRGSEVVSGTKEYAGGVLRRWREVRP